MRFKLFNPYRALREAEAKTQAVLSELSEIRVRLADLRETFTAQTAVWEARSAADNAAIRVLRLQRTIDAQVNDELHVRLEDTSIALIEHLYEKGDADLAGVPMADEDDVRTLPRWRQ